MKNHPDSHPPSDNNDGNDLFIKKYAALYIKKPRSKIFAPLSESYRQAGQLSKALSMAKKGVQLHPNFAAGHIALSRILIDSHELETALSHLKKATQLAPENILAHRLMAHTYLRLKLPKEALKAFKMVLFFDPHHIKAQKAVRKLESLTADEYEEDLFHMQPLGTSPIQAPHPKSPDSMGTLPPAQETRKHDSLHDYLSLIDAYISRNNLAKAAEIIHWAQTHFPEHPEILRRLSILQAPAQKETPQPPTSPPGASQKEFVHQEYIDELNRLLEQIQERRHDL